ncbi:hypothetical protein RvY_10586-2 [Ramazzottius varieornatus]|uniref:Exocyst complex component 2 n=1 Tax=Ramazzottius varieornatus TaxID=947166 RepID=A0A1D1VFQ0_RAMVA|nr:hypothetical protein RvY_10586-2 [Ramazzottius varieornatus]
MPGEPENQIQTCRNLSELGDEGDFGWECITDVHTYIMGKMLEIYSSYFTDVASAVYDLKRCLQSKIFQHIIFHIQVASPFDLEGDTFDEPIIVEPTSAHRVKHEPITSSTSICQLIRVVSEALAKSLDHLNRLCEAYFQGEMKKTGKDIVLSSDQSKFARQKEMVVEAVELYVVIIQCALKSREAMIKSEEFLEAVGSVVRVRKAVTGHCESSFLLRTLLVALKKSVVFALLDRGVSEMESVSASAFERPDKTLRLASKLPELITTVAAKTLTMIKPFLLPDSQYKTNVLDEAGSTEALLEKWNRLFNVPIETLRDFGDRGTGIVVFFSLMSAHTMVEKVLPRLFAMLKTMFGDTESNFHSHVEDRYADLSSDLTKSFVEMKAEPIMGVIEKQMNDHGIDWKHAAEPKNVNSYVTRIAMDLNQVIEELSVFANDPSVNDEIIRGIVTKVCEEVNRLFFVAPGFNAHGALQGTLDVMALRAVIGPYMSKSGEKMLEEAVRLMSEQNATKKNEAIVKILAEYTKTHKMLFLGQT